MRVHATPHLDTIKIKTLFQSLQHSQWEGFPTARFSLLVMGHSKLPINSTSLSWLHNCSLIYKNSIYTELPRETFVVESGVFDIWSRDRYVWGLFGVEDGWQCSGSPWAQVGPALSQPNGGWRVVSHYTPSGQWQAINPCGASTQPGSFRKSIKRVFTELCQIVMGI